MKKYLNPELLPCQYFIYKNYMVFLGYQQKFEKNDDLLHLERDGFAFPKGRRHQALKPSRFKSTPAQIKTRK